MNECAHWPYRALAECCACCCPFCSGATPARLSLSTATQEGSGGIRLPPDHANGTWNLSQSTDTWCVANIRKRAITRYRRTTSSAGTLIINEHRKLRRDSTDEKRPLQLHLEKPKTGRSSSNPIATSRRTRPPALPTEPHVPLPSERRHALGGWRTSQGHLPFTAPAKAEEESQFLPRTSGTGRNRPRSRLSLLPPPRLGGREGGPRAPGSAGSPR